MYQPFRNPGRDAVAVAILGIMLASMIFVGADVFAYFSGRLERGFFMSSLGAALVVSASIVVSRFPLPVHPYSGILRWGTVAAIIGMSSFFASYRYVQPIFADAGPTDAQSAAVSGLRSQLAAMDAQIDGLHTQASAFPANYRTRRAEVMAQAAAMVDRRGDVAGRLADAAEVAAREKPLSAWEILFRSSDALAIIALRLLLEISQIMAAYALAAMFRGGNHPQRSAIPPQSAAIPAKIPRPFRIGRDELTPRAMIRERHPKATAISDSGGRSGPYTVFADPKTRRVILGSGPNSMDAYRDAAAKLETGREATA